MKLKLKINGKHSALPPTAGLRSGIYARKSNEEDASKSEEHKSVARQVEHARKFIAAKGWTVAEPYVFEDDAWSGADFFNRPGLARLLASIPKRGKPPFDVLVMSEPSRLGREMTRTAALVLDLIEAGVRIFYYLTGDEEQADTPERKALLALKGYASESERVRTGQRVRDALLLKANAGQNPGGRCYGYDNVWILPDGARHIAEPGERKVGQWPTDYAINKAEAEIVRKIFALYIQGYGHASCAKILNRDPRYKRENKKYFAGVSPPSPRKGSGSWAPSSVRQLLLNPRYRGLIPFGRMRRVYRGGRPRRDIVGEAKFTERPDLEIVSEGVWNKVQKRSADARKCYVREANGTLWARPESGRQSKYLLSGLARCAECGASIIATKSETGPRHKRRLVPCYVCSYASKRGTSVCSNNARIPQDVVEEAFLRQIERILTPGRIDIALKDSLRHAKDRRRKAPDMVKQITAEIARLTREKNNLLSALKQGGNIKHAAVLEEIDRIGNAIEDKQRQLNAMPNPSEVSGSDLDSLKAVMADRLRRIPELMRADPVQARQALRKLLDDGKGRVQPLKCVLTVDRNGRKTFAFHIDQRIGLGALLNPGSEANVTKSWM